MSTFRGALVGCLLVLVSVPKAKPKDLAKDWWEKAIFYQVLVDSFKDSDGDGLGDIRGVTDKLDHVKWLGASSLVLSPLHTRVGCPPAAAHLSELDNKYGVEKDFTDLITKANQLDIRVVVSLEMSQMSVDSEMFARSANHTRGHEDDFTWSDEGEKKQTTLAGDSLWIYNELHGQYYLSKSPGTAQLALSGGGARAGVRAAATTWLTRGAHGLLVHADPRSNQDLNMLTELSLLLQDHTRMNGSPTRILMVEAIPWIGCEHVLPLYTFGAHLVLNLALALIAPPAAARELKHSIDTCMTFLPLNVQPNWMTGAWHTRRAASRFGDYAADAITARTMLLPGAVLLHQGDELGMRDARITNGDETACQLVRYSADSPFPWDDTDGAGFTTRLEPWLSLADDFRYANLRAQKKAPRSHLKFFQTLLRARQSPTIQTGDLEIKVLSEGVLAFVRHTGTRETFVLAANVGGSSAEVNLNAFPGLGEMLAVWAVSTGSARATSSSEEAHVRLAAGETLVMMAPPRTCSGPGPIDKIASKLNEAKEKLNKYFNLS